MTATEQQLDNHWLAVFIAVLSGIVCALQIGKLPIAAPFLQHDLGLSRSSIGNLGAIFPILRMIPGIDIGTIVVRTGLRRSISNGLVATGVSSLMSPLFR